MEISGSNFSETDASNNNASPNGAPEGMSPAGVNDTIRAVMGAVKRFWGRIQGANASTGSSNAYVVSPTVDLAAYVTGERYSFRANFANTDSATVNISSLGAKTIKKMTAAGKVALASGDIQDGQPVTVEYDGADLILVTPASGQLTLIGVYAASAGTQIAVTGMTGFTSYRAVLEGITPATGAADLQMQVSTDGGSTWDSTAGSYAWARFNQVPASGTGTGSNSAAFAQIANSLNSVAANSLDSVMDISINNEKIHSSCRSAYVSSGGDVVAQMSAQHYAGATPDAFRLYMSSGNITGTVRLYGLP